MHIKGKLFISKQSIGPPEFISYDQMVLQYYCCLTLSLPDRPKPSDTLLVYSASLDISVRSRTLSGTNLLFLEFWQLQIWPCRSLCPARVLVKIIVNFYCKINYYLCWIDRVWVSWKRTFSCLHEFDFGARANYRECCSELLARSWPHGERRSLAILITWLSIITQLCQGK